jgi:hypothetical protein
MKKLISNIPIKGLALTLILLFMTAGILITQMSATITPPAPIMGVNGDKYAPLDTITTAVGAVGLKERKFVISGNRSLVAVHVNIAKISGTVKGYIAVAAGLDTNANFDVIGSKNLVDTAGTKAYILTWAYNPGYYYKVIVRDTGLSTISAASWALARQ